MSDDEELLIKTFPKKEPSTERSERSERKKNKNKKKKGLPNGLPNISNPEEALEELMSNPQAFNQLMDTMKDNNELSSAIKEVASNPEAREAVSEMMGSKEELAKKSEQLREVMQKKGMKMPKRKEVLKLQKEHKKLFKPPVPEKEFTAVVLTPGNKVKSVKLDIKFPLRFFNQDKIDRVHQFTLGDLVLNYIPGTKPNKLIWNLVKDKWTYDHKIGNEVLIYDKNFNDINWEMICKVL